VCYHYHFQKPVKEVAKILRLDSEYFPEGDSIPGSVNGFSHPRMPVVINQKLEWMNWGLIPFWVKTEEMAGELWNQTLNARWESIHQKPSFQKIKENRCIVPCTGFWEWKQVGNSKIKHNIISEKEEFLFFAGMFDEWINPNSGECVKTFSILTQDANLLMADIHNSKKRMPVILGSLEQMEKWWSSSYAEAVVATPEDFLVAIPEQSLLF
jgi:putative SOS response-associated peptidase YedK